VDPSPELIGRAPAMQRMLGWIRRVAPCSLPVLVHGETGSGKEGAARLLHREGPRRTAPFVAVNCTALSESLLEAELFGAVRGAYTGAERDRPGLFRLAQGGTLLLDEVGDMSPAMQAKLLRVIEENRVRPVGGEQESAVDVRIVAATHRDLTRLVRDGAFRGDLYYRLAIIEVAVPPLRDRLEDLPLLVEHLAPRLTRETGQPFSGVASAALDALQHYDWPGNVRELRTVLARALLRANGRTIESRHLGPLQAGPGFLPLNDGPGRVPLERRMIETALAGEGGSVTRAARRIGWTRQKLYRRIRALAVPTDATP
jgi:DNA-binding NtrC family response regulator